MTRSNAWGRWIAAIAMAGLGGWAISAQQKPASADVLLGQAVHQEQSEGQYEAAIATYRQVLKAPDATREQQARAQFRIGVCYEQLGNSEARKAYEEVVRTFADQAEVAAQAKARLGVLRGQPATPAAVPSGPVMRQLWKDTKGAGWTRVSPDGRLLVGWDDDTGDLVVRNTSGGPIRRLTSNPKDRAWVDYADEPIWSPDSRRIACVWAMNANDRTTYATVLRIVQLEPFEVRDVKVDARFVLEWMRDWSPDGTRMLVDVKEKATGRTSLAWVSTEKGEVLQLGIPGENRLVSDAFVSPDGTRIVYTIRSQSAIHSLPAGGGPSVTLLTSPDSISLLGWAPTGDQLVFVSTREDGQQLMLLPVDAGGASQPVAVRAVPFRFGLGITRAGALVYLSRTPLRTDVYRADVDLSSGVAKNPMKVSAAPYLINANPVWSRDGRWLAFVSRQSPDSGSGALSIQGAKGTHIKSIALPFNPVNVTPASAPAGVGWLVSSPDGDRGAGLYHVDTESGAVETLLPIGAGVFNFNASPRTSLVGWSPDGRIVYKRVNYGEGTTGEVALVAHRVTDRTEQQIFRSSGPAGLGGLDVSPDGTQLVFSLHSSAGHRLVTMPAAGGPTSTIFESVSPPYLYGGRWSDGGTAIVWTTYTGKASETRRLDLTSRSRQRIDCGLSPVYNVTLSPNGREISFSHRLPQQDDGLWILENFLPPAPVKSAPTPGQSQRR